MLNQGMITIDCGPNSIRFIPPLVINREEMDIALNILEKAVDQVESL